MQKLADLLKTMPHQQMQQDLNQKPMRSGKSAPPALLQEPSSNPNTQKNWIDEFFLRLSIIYPYKWAGQFPSAEAVVVGKSEWVAGLDDLSREEIQKGISKCRKEGGEFPPSIPEFRKMCLPTLKEMDVLDEEEAYQQLSNRDYSHPLVKSISQKIDEYGWRMMTIKEARQRFKAIYNLCSDKQISEYEDRRRFHLSLEELEEQEPPRERELEYQDDERENDNDN